MALMPLQTSEYVHLLSHAHHRSALVWQTLQFSLLRIRRTAPLNTAELTEAHFETFGTAEKVTSPAGVSINITTQ